MAYSSVGIGIQGKAVCIINFYVRCNDDSLYEEVQDVCKACFTVNIQNKIFVNKGVIVDVRLQEADENKIQGFVKIYDFSLNYNVHIYNIVHVV